MFQGSKREPDWIYRHIDILSQAACFESAVSHITCNIALKTIIYINYELISYNVILCTYTLTEYRFKCKFNGSFASFWSLHQPEQVMRMYNYRTQFKLCCIINNLAQCFTVFGAWRLYLRTFLDDWRRTSWLHFQI